MSHAASDRIADLARRLGPGVRLQEPMARHASLRVGGPAELFLVARNAQQLVTAVDEASQRGITWHVIGSASNLLIADAGVAGLVVKAAGGNAQHVRGPGGDVLVRADSGCFLAALGKQSAAAGLAGLEWAVNVPGTVGASVVNNSGAFDSCISEHLVDAELYIPGRGVCSLTANELDLGYRTSRLKRGEIVGAVLAARYRLMPEDVDALQARVRENQLRRRSTQPSGFSVGSVFANPPGGHAGALIERVGLKGKRIGGAEISQLHANFIVNRRAASARDVLDLMNLVQQRVWQSAGQWLTPEIQLLGELQEDEAALLPSVAKEVR